MSQHLLTIDNVTFAYKKNNPVLKGINLSFEEGKITALLGNNGCGKTTLLRILAGITTADSGSFSYDGLNIDKHTVIEYKRNIGYMPEMLQLYPSMVAYKALAFFAKLRNCPKERVMETIKKVGLIDHYKKTVQSLSKGLKQRLNLAQAIISNPSIIIFDEPSNGFDCAGVQNFYLILKELANKGAIVIITTHLFSDLFSRVDNIAIMGEGKIIKFGSVYDLQEQEHNYLSHVVFSLDRTIEPKVLETIKYPLQLIRPNLLSVDILPNQIEDLILKLNQTDIHFTDMSFKRNSFEQNLEGFLL